MKVTAESSKKNAMPTHHTRYAHKNSTKRIGEFIDNRSEAAAIEGLQQLADKNHQAMHIAQLRRMAEHQEENHAKRIAVKQNHTGLPDNLKSGIENLSGYALDDVKVHYNSSKPAQLFAHAYAQGSNIHIAPGQEKHLPHETWHVVQQKKGTVKPTIQMAGGININDDVKLEQEADSMGEIAMRAGSQPTATKQLNTAITFAPVYQRIIDFSKVSKTVPAKNEGELVAFLVAKYGENHRGFIEGKIKEIQDSNGIWSLYDVYRYFVGQRLPVYSDVVFGEHSTQPTLPSSGSTDRERYVAAVNQFGFNTVTRLVGIVGNKKFETRNSTDDDQHAEEVFMEQVDRSGIKLHEETRIVITINNSPCHAKCAILLANWVKSWGFRHVTIHFANPYGSDEEFNKAIKILQSAGIKIHGFDPLDNIGSDTDDEIEEDYRERFKKMTNSLKRAKGNKLYLSDEETSDHEEGSMIDDSSQSESDDSLEGFDQQYSDQLLSRARQFWDNGVHSAFERIGEQGESMDIDDMGGMLATKTDNPYELDYIENDDEYHLYLSEISEGIEWCVENIVEEERPSQQVGVQVMGESGVKSVIVESVRQFLQQYRYHGNRNILVVSGKAWTCYIRCVLHRLRRLEAYDTIVNRLARRGIDLSSGVVVGSDQETQVQQIIEQVIGVQFHVNATDVAHGHGTQSAQAHGTAVDTILTGAHFSLLQ